MILIPAKKKGGKLSPPFQKPFVKQQKLSAL